MTPTITRRRFIGSSMAALALGAAPAAADEPELTLKFATVAPPGTPWARHTSRLKKRVKEETGGRVRVEPALGGTLGGEQATVERVKRGPVTGWAGGASGLTDMIPEFSALELPFFFSETDRARRAMDTVAERIRELLAPQGLELLYVGERGMHVVGGPRPVREPSDAAGLRISAPPRSPRLRMWQALGARPQAVGPKVVADMLKRDRVEAFSGAPAWAVGAGWTAHVQHITVTHHLYEPELVVARRSALDALSAADRRAVVGEAAAESRWIRKALDAAQTAALSSARAAGVQVTQLDDAARAAFARATAPVAAEFRQSTTDAGRALLAALEAAR